MDIFCCFKSRHNGERSPLLPPVNKFDNHYFTRMIAADMKRIKLFADDNSYAKFCSMVDNMLEKQTTPTNVDVPLMVNEALRELVPEGRLHDLSIESLMYMMEKNTHLASIRFLWLWSPLLLGNAKDKLCESVQNVKANHSLLVYLGENRKRLKAYLMLIAYMIEKIHKYGKDMIEDLKRGEHGMLIYLESSISQAMGLLMQEAGVPDEIRCDVMAIVRSSDENASMYCHDCRKNLVMKGVSGHCPIMENVHYKFKDVRNAKWPEPVCDNPDDRMLDGIDKLAKSVMKSLLYVTKERGPCCICGVVYPKIRETWMVTATNMILFNQWLELVPTAMDDLEKFIKESRSTKHIGVCTVWDVAEHVLQPENLVVVDADTFMVEKIRSSYNSVIAVGGDRWIMVPLLASSLGHPINNIKELVTVRDETLDIGLYMVDKRNGVDWVGHTVYDEGTYSNDQFPPTDATKNLSMTFNTDSKDVTLSIGAKGCVDGRPLFGTPCNHTEYHGYVDARCEMTEKFWDLEVDTESDLIYSVMSHGNIKAQACVLAYMQQKGLWAYMQSSTECGSCAHERASKEHCSIIIN